MAVMEIYEGQVCQPPTGGNITIIVARFNKTITQRLLDGALAKLRHHKVYEHDVRIVWVPGAYELPFMADHFARDKDCMAIICLGAVIKGETSHHQHINRSVSMSLGETANRFGKPVIFGVITCETVEQADARSGVEVSKKDKTISPLPGNKGAEAAEAALEMIDLMQEVPCYREDFSPKAIFSQLFGDEDDADDDGEDDGDFFPTFPPLLRQQPVKVSKKSAKKATKKGTKKK